MPPLIVSITMVLLLLPAVSAVMPAAVTNGRGADLSYAGGVPLVGATVSGPVDGAEWELMRHGAWSFESWSAYSDVGFVLLRHPEPGVIVAWAAAGVSIVEPLEIYSSEVAMTRIDVAEWRGPDAVGAAWKVVLEPRLPADEVDRLLGEFERVGLAPEVLLRPDSDLALSTSIMLTPRLASQRQWLLHMPGVWWVEPLLETVARDAMAASLLETGSAVDDGYGAHPAWLLGLDASGVVIGVADSGIDRDHACFRNATAPGATGADGEAGVDAVGEPGPAHRSIVALNDSIDDWDDDTQDFGHGTHIAGILGCRLIERYRADEMGDWQNATPDEMASLSHAARLVVQDIVADDEWLEPDFDWLLAEALQNGAIIHSDSWGDANEEYTQRSSDLDAWLVEVPWSLAFIAPGNSGSKFYEPANARNVVAVAATPRDGGSDIMASSATGPTEEGLRGNYIAAPGISIKSAASDGARTSMNDGASQKTGTSFSTPMAASTAAVIQQMLEDGWLRTHNETAYNHSIDTVRPGWAWVLDQNVTMNGSLLLSPGFTPSGAMLRALLALSAEPLEGGHHGAATLGAGPDEHQGWGRPDLSRLVDFAAVEAALLNDESVDPAASIWLHDSFRLVGQPHDLTSDWLTEPGARPLESVVQHEWNGSGAAGPFLAYGENATWVVEWDGVSDLDIFLTFSPRPFGLAHDDVDLQVTLPDGRVAMGNDLVDGWSRLGSAPNQSAADPLEATERVRISAVQLTTGPIEVRIIARDVGLGSVPGSLGLEGDRLGFAIAAAGVVREEVRGVLVLREGDGGNTTGSGEGVGNSPPSLTVISPGAGAVIYGDILVEWSAVDVDGDSMLADVDLIRWNGSSAEVVGLGCTGVTVNNGSPTNCSFDVTHLLANATGFWSVRITIHDMRNGSAIGAVTVDSAAFELRPPTPDCPLCGLLLIIPEDARMFEEVTFSADPSATPGWQHWGGGVVEWDLGDGHQATGWSVNHTYTTDPASGLSNGPRTRVVAVCVTFDDGPRQCDGGLIKVYPPLDEDGSSSSVSSTSPLIGVLLALVALFITGRLFMLGRHREGVTSRSHIVPPPFEQE